MVIINRNNYRSGEKETDIPFAAVLVRGQTFIRIFFHREGHMDTFEKSDLIYEYSWSQYKKDDPRISGIPDATEFNRREGHEVLYLIRQLADHLGWELAHFGHRMEKIIHERLPVTTRTQKDTIQWIQENWRKFPYN